MALDVLVLLPKEDFYAEVMKGRGLQTVRDGSVAYQRGIIEVKDGILSIGFYYFNGVNQNLIDTLRRLEPRWLVYFGWCIGNGKHVVPGDLIVADRVFRHDINDVDTHQLDDYLQQVLGMDRLSDEIKELARDRPPSRLQQKLWLLACLHRKKDPSKEKDWSTHFSVSDEYKNTIQQLKKEGLVKIHLLTRGLALTEAGMRVLEDHRTHYPREESWYESSFNIHMGTVASGNDLPDDFDFASVNRVTKLYGVDTGCQPLWQMIANGKTLFLPVLGVIRCDEPNEADFKKFLSGVALAFIMEFAGRELPPTRNKGSSRENLLPYMFDRKAPNTKVGLELQKYLDQTPYKAPLELFIEGVHEDLPEKYLVRVWQEKLKPALELAEYAKSEKVELFWEASADDPADAWTVMKAKIMEGLGIEGNIMMIDDEYAFREVVVNTIIKKRIRAVCLRMNESSGMARPFGFWLDFWHGIHTDCLPLILVYIIKKRTPSSRPGLQINRESVQCELELMMKDHVEEWVHEYKQHFAMDDLDLIEYLNKPFDTGEVRMVVLAKAVKKLELSKRS